MPPTMPRCSEMLPTAMEVSAAPKHARALKASVPMAESPCAARASTHADTSHAIVSIDSTVADEEAAATRE